MTPTKILIVEDDFTIVEILIAKLYEKGYLVCAVTAEGKNAIEKTKSEKPDLVLINIALKGEMDGIETADRIRSATGTPVVYLAERIGQEMLERAKITEPYGFVLKPIIDNGLFPIIETGLYKAGQDRILRERELKFRTVADFSHHWEFWLGPDDDFLYNSPSCERISGFARKDFAKNPYLFFEIVYEKDQKKVALQYKKARKSKKPFELVYRIATSSGEQKWIGQACVPVFSRSGAWEGFRGTNRDITAARRNERKKHKFEELGFLSDTTAREMKSLLSEIRGHLSAAKKMSKSSAGLSECLEKAASACLVAEQLTEKYAGFSGLKTKRNGGVK